jgi:hypothetical protein
VLDWDTPSALQELTRPQGSVLANRIVVLYRRYIGATTLRRQSSARISVNASQPRSRSCLCPLCDGSDHLGPYPDSLGEARRKILLNLVEAVFVSLEITKGHAIRPSSCCESEFEVIRSERVIVYCRVDGLCQQRFIAVQILGNTEPDAEEL